MSVSRPSTSREMIFRQKLEKHKFHTKVIVTVLQLKTSRESFCASVMFFVTNFAIVLPAKNACFQFYKADVTVF